MKLWLKNNLSKSEECFDTEPLACTDLIWYDSFDFFVKRHFLKSLVIRVGKIVTNLGHCFQVIYGTGPCITKDGCIRHFVAL